MPSGSGVPSVQARSLLSDPGPQITDVHSAEELIKAIEDGAQDIEIKQHLDLRHMMSQSSAMNVLPTGIRPDTEVPPHLFQARSSSRSIRGNCSLPSPKGLGPHLAAEMRLDEGDGGVAALLPFKPYQCLLLVSSPWLAIPDAPMWLDNIYLRSIDQPWHPHWAFVTSGQADVCATNVTFHAGNDHRFGAIGVFMGANQNYDLLPSRLLVDDCIFHSWSGWSSPLTIENSVAVVRNSAFMDAWLSVEVADVSFGGSVHFENVELSNVTLKEMAVVSTTRNDWVTLPACEFRHEPEDDAAYNVTVDRVHPHERGTFGAEFVIRNETMSDCLYLPAPEGAVLPGCPPESAETRWRMRRGLTHHYSLLTDDGDVCELEPAPPVSAGRAPDPDVHAGFLRNDPSQALVLFTSMRGELPARPPPPAGWPTVSFAPATAPEAAERVSLAPAPQPPSAGIAAALLPPICLAPACTSQLEQLNASAGPHTAPPVPRGPDVAAAVAFTLAAALALGLIAVVWRCCRCRGEREKAAGVGPYVKASLDASSGITRDEERSGRDAHAQQRGRFSHATARIEALDTVLLAGHAGVSAAYTRLMHAKKYPRKTLRQGGLGGAAQQQRQQVQGGPPWAQTEQPWWLTGVEGGTQASTFVPFDAIEAHVGETLKPSLFARLSRGLRTPPEADQLELAATPSAAAEQHGGRRGSYGSTHHGLSTQHAAGGGTRGRVLHSREDALSSCRLAGDTDPPSCLWSADTQSSALTTPQCETPTPLALVAKAEYDPRVSTGHGSFWAQHAQHAQHSPAAQHAQRPQHARGDDFAYSSELSGTTEAQSGVAAGSLPTELVPLALIRETYGHSTELGEETWGRNTHSTLAPAPDIGLSATDATFTAHDIRVLQRQLDGFGSSNRFLGRFEMLGPEQRRRGGQAVVQFARGADDSFDYAVKFFLDPDAFTVEAALYAACYPAVRDMLGPTAARLTHAHAAATGGERAGDAQMSAAAVRFLPQVEAVCDTGVDARGRPLPPCIVMEKGESLHDWSDRAEPDLFTALGVLSNISLRLADMHDAGFVHRDLKPANVMWLPRENRWTVIDFGCVARIGADAPLSFTLAYAAPEVVAAFHGSQAKITATAALDAWSLGVMAFELLTGEPPFRLLTDGRCRVFAQLMGELPLPWEGGLAVHAARRLGAFKGPVLQLLERDPRRRPTLRRFHDTCTRLFANRTTVEA